MPFHGIHDTRIANARRRRAFAWSPKRRFQTVPSGRRGPRQSARWRVIDRAELTMLDKRSDAFFPYFIA